MLLLLLLMAAAEMGLKACECVSGVLVCWPKAACVLTDAGNPNRSGQREATERG
jgi:hypothetical protein